jgi:hypothetical protein
LFTFFTAWNFAGETGLGGMIESVTVAAIAIRLAKYLTTRKSKSFEASLAR